MTAQRSLCSKHPLQRELHNAWVFRREHLAKCVAVESRDDPVCDPCTTLSGASHSEAVRDVKCFCSKIQLLRFTNLESPRHGQIELPCAGAAYRAGAGVSERAKRR